MIGVGLFLCVLALLVIGLLAMVAWDACEYDKRIGDLETKLGEQSAQIADLYVKLAELYRHVARDVEEARR